MAMASVGIAVVAWTPSVLRTTLALPSSYYYGRDSCYIGGRMRPVCVSLRYQSHTYSLSHLSSFGVLTVYVRGNSLYITL